jgi:3-deoxy-D-manno-octulosonic-acid transferase
LDFSWAVNTALLRVRPDLLILAELELWPNLIRLTKRRHCRIAIVNGRLSDRSFRGYQRLRPILTPVFHKLDLIAAQNVEYATRVRDLIGNEVDVEIQVTGSVKFDGTLTNRHNTATCRFKELAGITDQDVVMLAGSTQDPEEELAVATFRECSRSQPHLRLLLAPRHVTRCNDIAAMLNRVGIPWQRRTALDTQGADPQARILLIDTIGELAAWWGTSHIAFVGGSMGSRGGQNMIEPAGFGAAVCFGPNTSNFRDIVQMLLRCNGAMVVHDGSELTQFVQKCLERPEWAQSLGRAAQQLVLSQQGATERTMQLLRDLMAGSELPNSSKAA